MSYKILTLDGGGAWALIQVRTLIALYGAATKGHDILAKFDLVAANSGGSLVLAGLVENLDLGTILASFLNPAKIRAIFSPSLDPGNAILRQTLGIGPKYSAQAKLPAIERLFPKMGDRALAGIMSNVPAPNGAAVRLLIVGFDYDRNRAVHFRSTPATGPALGPGQPANISLAGAVHASTNAPVNYFDAPAEIPFVDDRYWDGGITGNNNPAVVAVVEAMGLGNAPTSFRVLSLGTGTVSLPLAPVGRPASPFEGPRTPSSVPDDLKKLAGAILDDPPDAATFIAHTIMGGASGLPASLPSRIVRMSPLVASIPDGHGGLKAPAGWSAAQFQYLANIELDVPQPMDITYVDDYCLAWLADEVPNQPIRDRHDTYDPWNPDLGHAKFSLAKAAWLALDALAAPPLVA